MRRRCVCSTRGWRVTLPLIALVMTVGVPRAAGEPAQTASPTAPAGGPAQPLPEAVVAACADLVEAHPVSLHAQGADLHRRGDFSAAERHYHCALARLANPAPEWRQLKATVLSALGILRGRQGRYDEAAALHRQALASREALLGPQHADVGSSLSNLGEVARARGNWNEGRELFRKSLRVLEAVVPPAPLRVALTHNNLGALLTDMGRFTEADRHLKLALELRERHLGESSRAAAISANNLALNRRLLGDVAGAEALFRRALAAFEKDENVDPHTLVAALLNLGSLAFWRRDYATAEPLYARAQQVLQSRLPQDRLLESNLLHCLGNLDAEQGRWPQAERRLRHARALAEAAYGVEHPRTAGLLLDLAAVVRKQGGKQEAQQLHTVALSLRAEHEQRYGTTHSIDVGRLRLEMRGGRD